MEEERTGDSGPSMTSHRPYLLRALYEWISDNDMTPHLLVDAGQPGVQVLDPEQLAHGVQSITPMRVVEMSLARCRP